MIFYPITLRMAVLLCFISPWRLYLTSFVIVKFCPNKKGGQEKLSLYPPVLVACLVLLYQVPGFLLINFKRPKIHIYLDLVLAFEILWHSPRVPAYTASAILEVARDRYDYYFLHEYTT